MTQNSQAWSFYKEDLHTCGVPMPQQWDWDENCVIDTVVSAQTCNATVLSDTVYIQAFTSEERFATIPPPDTDGPVNTL